MKKIGLCLVILLLLGGCKIKEEKIKKEPKKINYDKYFSEKVIAKGSIYNADKKKVSSAKGFNFNLVKDKGPYFKIKDTNYYLKYDEVEQKDFENETRSFEYLVTKKVKTIKNFKLYNSVKDKFLKLDKEETFDVYIKDGDYYGVKFNDNLFYVKKEDVASEEDVPVERATRIPVLNYHFFYDPKIKTEVRERQTISIDINLFDAHLSMIKNEGYFSLKAKEVDMWLDGKIELPKKNLLLTVDDGQIFTDKYLKHYVDKHQVHAVLFNITKYSDTNQYRSPYLEVQSHTHSLHVKQPENNIIRTPSNSSDELLYSDIKQSIDIIGDNTAFAYPYYVKFPRLVKVLKQLGFKNAYIGGGRYVRRGMDKYSLPRFEIYDGTSVARIRNILNG